MNHDKPLVAVLIGVISVIPFQIITMIVKYLGFVKVNLYELDSLVITGNRPIPLLGFVVSSIVAGFIAFVFYYALAKIGTDYLIIKSALISVFVWSLLEVVMTFGLEGIKIPQRHIASYYTQLTGALVYGITMGILFKRFLITRASNTR